MLWSVFLILIGNYNVVSQGIIGDLKESLRGDICQIYINLWQKWIMGSTRGKYRNRRELVPQRREEERMTGLGVGAERDASERSWRREVPRGK